MQAMQGISSRRMHAWLEMAQKSEPPRIHARGSQGPGLEEEEDPEESEEMEASVDEREEEEEEIDEEIELEEEALFEQSSGQTVPPGVERLIVPPQFGPQSQECSPSSFPVAGLRNGASPMQHSGEEPAGQAGFFSGSQQFVFARLLTQEEAEDEIEFEEEEELPERQTQQSPLQEALPQVPRLEQESVSPGLQAAESAAQYDPSVGLN